MVPTGCSSGSSNKSFVQFFLILKLCCKVDSDVVQWYRAGESKEGETDLTSACSSLISPTAAWSLRVWRQVEMRKRKPEGLSAVGKPQERCLLGFTFHSTILWKLLSHQIPLLLCNTLGWDILVASARILKSQLSGCEFSVQFYSCSL